MIKKPKITLIYAEDWAGLYKDGKLVVDGHSVSCEELAKAAELDFEEVNASIYFDSYENDGRCPDELSSITEKLDALKGKQ